MRTSKKNPRRGTVIFNAVCCLFICLLLTTYSAKSCLASPITSPVVIASTETLDRVGEFAVEKVIDSIVGAAKDVAEGIGAVLAPDVANLEGSQPAPNERAENFRERTGRDSGSSGGNSGSRGSSGGIGSSGRGGNPN